MFNQVELIFQSLPLEMFKTPNQSFETITNQTKIYHDGHKMTV